MAGAETALEGRDRLVQQYAAELDELARWADEQGLPEQALQTRQWLPAPSPGALVMALPDEPSGGLAPREGLAGPLAEWHERFAGLRRVQAGLLFDLADAAVADGQTAVAWRLVHEVLREDPEHEAVRRLLGYQRHEGRWLTPFEIGKARSGQLWHQQFGWLRAGDVSRYEAGERFYKGRWIDAEEDARLHAEIARGWDVITEHYVVRTNHSLEEGVRLASRLERLYAIWRQVFVRYYASDDELARRFRDGAPGPRSPRRHQVVFFRDRDEYVQALKKHHPSIKITTGYYQADQRKAYFFAGSERDDTNLYHEATHQLFSESRGVARQIGRDANFWVVEGIACYVESLVDQNGVCTLGGHRAGRLHDARFRLLEDNFYLPLAEFTAFGMDALQRDRRIAMLYSQAAGLTHFLMHYDGGRYRDALVDYLVAVYTGRDGPGTLVELTGQSFAELDRQYRAFIETTGSDQ